LVRLAISAFPRLRSTGLNNSASESLTEMVRARLKANEE
jgi:hypothetical protein